MDAKARIYIAGHTGLVGSALVRESKRLDYHNLVLRTHAELELTAPGAVDLFFQLEKPEYVFIAAAKVGGIVANRDQPVDFFQTNLLLQTNLIRAAHEHNVRKLLVLGSSCIYPRLAPQPIREDALLTSPLEPTNEAYAIAKIAGIRLCQAYRRQYGSDFISVMPCNLYGPGDNYLPDQSHVIPGLIRRFHEAKRSGAATVTCWGSGAPLREFLYVDDLAVRCNPNPRA